MKKKEFLTEAKRKAIIADKEKAILESFAKTFNKIKRIDENEVNENWEEEQKKKELQSTLSQAHGSQPSDEEMSNVMSAMAMSNDKKINEYSDDGELSEEVGNEGLVDDRATSAYSLVKQIGGILKDEIHTAPDEYGMTTPELVKTFLYNFDTVENDEGKIIGFRKGDLASFVARAKNYLMNIDLISLNDYTGEVDVNNSNSPEIANLLLKLENL